ncbi:hypothetical protein MELB17_00300 [Marinobacter sp. ELB17]|nr:hypothetical protein MELB17_00300 [Marinobacter sp. ELB17]
MGGIQYRRVDYRKVKPFIWVQFEGQSRSFVPVDLVPLLVVGSRYQNKERIPETGTDAHQFKVTGEPTAVASESGENWMHFDNEDGSTVRVRQLELARCLFLHNHHLTRTAFRPNGLKGLAHPLIDGKTTVIKFSSLADYPLSNLRSKSALQHLAWILLDDDARRSFDSILVGLMSSPKELWNFRFAPPNMKNWEISGSGYYSSSDDKNFTVNEITGFDNPTRYRFNEILVDHPRFKQLLPKKPESGKRPIVQRGDPDPLLDLGYEPELGRRLDQVTDQRFTFSFDKSLQVKVRVNGQTFRIKPRVDPESVPISETTSPGHADERGTGRELDHGINRSESDDHYLVKLNDAQPSDRFSFFEGVVSRLTKRPNFSLIELGCYSLPPTRTNRHAVCDTYNGERVQCYVAWIECRSILIAIIEVDTESMIHDRSLSNLIVSFDQDADAKHLIDLFLQSCSDEGVHWKASRIQAYSAAWGTSNHPDRNVKKRPARNIKESSDQRTKEDKQSVRVDLETYEKRWVSNLHGATQKVARNMRRK